MDKQTRQFKTVDRFVIQGVPYSSLPALCKELGADETALKEYLNGQTMGLVGNEPLVYPWDIKRFLRKLPVID